MIAKTGTYTGNGQNNRNIPELNFRPDFLMIKGQNQSAQLSLSTFPVDRTKDFNGGLAVNGIITELTISGFTVSNNNQVNKNGENYTYMAFKAEPGKIKSGTYTGNGNDNREISGTGFEPDMIIIIAENNNEKPIFSSITMGPDKSMNFLNSDFDKNCIQAFRTNGFQVGKDKAVNDNAVIYHYIALKNSPGAISIGSYLGNGDANRVIPGAGGGNFSMVKTDKKNANFRAVGMATDRSGYFKNSGFVTERIKRNIAPGFVVGSNDEVNKTGDTYHYLQINSNFQVLAVQWLSFEVKALTSKNSLVWETAREVNNNYFSIESSWDGVTYKRIGKISGKGNSNSISQYQFDDNAIVTGVTFYRIRQVDLNGKVSYSSVRKLVRTNIQSEASTQNNNFKIFPNPFAGNNVFIDYEIKQAQIEIVVLNSSGVKMHVLNLKKGENKLKLPDNLSPGNYLLVGRDGGKQLFSKKILKVK